MILHLAVAFLSALATMVLVPVVRRLAPAVGALDYPVARRKIHRGVIPRLGGVAVFVPTMTAVAVSHWWLARDGQIASEQFLALLGGSLAILGLGLYDDIKGADAWTKFGVQFAVAVLACAVGLNVMRVSTPFGGSLDLGRLGFVVTVFWLIGMTNGMNLLDGMDGLAAGIGAIGALTLVVASAMLGRSEVSLAGVALLGSLLGFLVFNFHPASIFLGDSGALFIGFFLAALSMADGQQGVDEVGLVVPIIALGVPILDTTLAFVRRILRGTHPFQSDRDHLHHRLLALGFSQRKAALTLYAFSAALAVMAILTMQVGRMGLGLILVCVAGLAATAIRRLGIGDVAELVGLLLHGERRRRPPRCRSILLRNTLPLLEQQETLAELAAPLERVREGLELSMLRLSLIPGLLPGAQASKIVLGNGTTWRAPARARQDGEWSYTTEIHCGMRCFNGNHSNANGKKPLLRCRVRSEACSQGCGRRIGEVAATKPKWKRRRQSENDEQLLQLLADGLGYWLVSRMPVWAAERVTILLANQDQIARELIERVLNEQYGIIQARDGAETIAKAREVRPDLLLLDSTIGRAVSRALKADVWTQGMPIVLLGGTPGTADTVHGVDLGPDDYLLKPFDSSELKARAHMVLRRA